MLKMMEFGVTAWGSEGGSNPLMTILIVVFALLLSGAIGRGLWVWFRNNHSPLQTVNARVAAKRMKVSGHGMHTMGNVSAMNGVHSPTYTRYFATFETEDGRRVELGVRDSEYGMLAENDRGLLSFQGTRYLGFERN